MKLIGNILWFFLGGIVLGLSWIIVGLLWCCTIIGIPVGIQCFKMSLLAFWPFGKEVSFSDSTTSVLLNILWIMFSGIELAVTNFVIGVLFCITIIGIPFGKQYFKMAKLSLLPFGAVIS
ncbi:MAG: YccF domain-containing protein [Treponema sp.]|nr:YccF domain-containing protein [Treponema sp.]